MPSESRPFFAFQSNGLEESPQNILDGGITLAALVAAGGLAYNVGKDIVPRLKGDTPIVVEFIDSKLGEDGVYYWVHFSIRNLTIHGVYIEGFEPLLPKSLSILGISGPPKRGVGHNPPHWEDSAVDAPKLIEAEGRAYFWIKIPIHDINSGKRRMEYGTFRIRYTELYNTEVSETGNIHFKIRPGGDPTTSGG